MASSARQSIGDNFVPVIVSPPAMGHDGIFETEIRSSTVVVPIIVKIIPTPAREKRILWDQFHSEYPQDTCSGII